MLDDPLVGTNWRDQSAVYASVSWSYSRNFTWDGGASSGTGAYLVCFGSSGSSSLRPRCLLEADCSTSHSLSPSAPALPIDSSLPSFQVFDGVKMAADVSVNGRPLGHTSNQFNRYIFSRRHPCPHVVPSLAKYLPLSALS